MKTVKVKVWWNPKTEQFAHLHALASFNRDFLVKLGYVEATATIRIPAKKAKGKK